MADKKVGNEDISKKFDEIINRIKNVENEMSGMRGEVHGIEESVAILKHGTSGFRQKIIEEAKEKGELQNVHLPHKLLIKIREDTRLTEQEKKLAEFFNSQFDDSTEKYKDLTYTEVKKDAPIDRSKINEILNRLIEKNIILKRKTNYRAFYKINFKAYDWFKPLSGFYFWQQFIYQSYPFYRAMDEQKVLDKDDGTEEASVLFLEGCGYYELSAYYAAIESLKEARQIYDLNDTELFVKIRILLSMCYRKLKYRMLSCTALEEAEKCIKEAYNADPNNPKVNAELANVYYDLAMRLRLSFEKFLEEKEKCIFYIENGNNGFKESWQKKLNLIEAKFDNFEKSLFNARNFLKNAIKLDPTNLSHKYGLGAVYYNLRHHKGCEFDAIKLFEEVLLNDKEFKNYYRIKLFEKMLIRKDLW